jgi:Ca-activated chloride channel family protein
MSRKSLLQRSTALLVLVALVLTACGSGGNNNLSATAQPAPNALHISFLYSSEKQAWVDAVTKTFNDNNVKTASGKSIYVDTKPTGSGEMTTDVLMGVEQPTLWSPASSIWVPLLNDGWTQKQGKDLISETCKNVVLSPVVIMMWKPMAEALGWPQKDIGWADIAQIATDPKGFASYGKPQLGKFRFGHTHPDYSNSGLQTIIAMAYAARNQQSRLTVQDVQDPKTADFINKLESAVAHYGSSTGFFGTAMISRGTSYLSAAVVYESVVVSSYSANPAPEFPLVAIYPKEGTFQSDHPMCIPDATWVTTEQKEAANIYRDYLLSKPAQEQALQFGFRPADPNIAIGAPIDAAHGVDPKQPQNTLPVPNAKTIQAVRDLWKAQKRKVNLTLLIDISGSMKDDNKIKGARDGAAAFIDQLDPSDNLTIIAFDESQQVLIDNQNVGQSRDKMKQEVSALIPQGGTALFDSISYSVKNMKVDPTRINAVVVLTDGQDTNSTQYKNVDTLVADLSKGSEGEGAEVSVFTIGYGKDADTTVLKQIAEKLRGAYRAGSTADIAAVYRDISTFF